VLRQALAICTARRLKRARREGIKDGSCCP
jgi:hypothetical protein